MNSEQNLTREEAIAILNTPDEQLNELIERAGALRKKYKGNHVSIHLLTNARSGNCSQNCAYCAQSCRSHADIEKYKWVDDEKLYGDNTFVHDHKLSRHCIGLSGMKFSDAEIEELASKIHKMKEEGTHLCCSIGFLTKKQALMLKEAGLDRINHNLNTSRSNYPNICTTHTYDMKIETWKKVKAEGMCACSGGIIGMGETWEDRLDMAVSLAELGIDSIPINALMPIPGTPLEGLPRLSEADILRTIAFFRYINPDANIRLAAGRALLTNDGEIAFQAGASASITGNMLTPVACATIRSDRRMLEDLGRDVTPVYWTEEKSEA